MPGVCTTRSAKNSKSKPCEFVFLLPKTTGFESSSKTVSLKAECLSVQQELQGVAGEKPVAVCSLGFMWPPFWMVRGQRNRHALYGKLCRCGIQLGTGVDLCLPPYVSPCVRSGVVNSGLGADRPWACQAGARVSLSSFWALLSSLCRRLGR